MGRAAGKLKDATVRAYLNSELAELGAVCILVLHQEVGGAQLVQIHLEGLVSDKVLCNLGCVLVDLVGQLLWRRTSVLAVVPAPFPFQVTLYRELHASQSLHNKWHPRRAIARNKGSSNSYRCHATFICSYVALT